LARSIAITGDRLLFTEDSDLRIFDISDPTAPTESGSERLGLGAYIDLLGEYVVLGLEWVGVQIMRIDEPSRNATLDTFDTADRPDDVFVSGELIYVADGNGGVYILRLVDAPDS
jgi:hypothetical protein